MFHAVFCGSVDDDLIGDFLNNFAQRQNFEFLKIGSRKDRNTTLVFVELLKA